MIKRILELSQEAAHLSVKHKQLRVRSHGGDGDEIRMFSCEDLGVVCIDHPGTTYTHKALLELVENGTAVVLCGSNHMPAAQLLPFSGHTEVVSHMQLQMDASRPIKKRLWQQIVQAKIARQAENLEWKAGRQHLRRMARRVRSGDPENFEAQAARYYWSNFLGEEDGFRRVAGGTDSLNSLLNYGYAVLRAAVARALVIGGLLPAIGVHHKNRSNSFNLADDLIEPFRPLIDHTVRNLFRDGREELVPDVKAEFLALLSAPVEIREEVGPLMVSLHAMTASFRRYLRGESRELVLPRPTIFSSPSEGVGD